MKFQTSRKINAVIFLLPWIFGFYLFFARPVYQSLVFSFHSIEIADEGGMKMTYNGFNNYRELFTGLMDSRGRTFARVFSEENIRIFLNTPVIIIFSLFAAILINMKFRGRGIVRAIFFLPIFIGMNVVQKLITVTSGTDLVDSSITAVFSDSFIMRLMLEYTFLPKNVAVFLSKITSGIFTLVSNCGVQTIIFLAGLQSIGNAIYESADIEGANGYEKFWKITLPMLKNNVVIFVIVYTFVDLFLASSMAQEIYIFSFRRANIGTGAALSVIYMINVLIALLIFLMIFSLLQRDKRN